MLHINYKIQSCPRERCMNNSIYHYKLATPPPPNISVPLSLRFELSFLVTLLPRASCFALTYSVALLHRALCFALASCSLRSQAFCASHSRIFLYCISIRFSNRARIFGLRVLHLHLAQFILCRVKRSASGKMLILKYFKCPKDKVC